jgi:biopolymer transport protein ExbD
MKFAGGRRVASPVDVTPLIDIIFQLVIFFMVTTNFITTPGIEVDLPRSSAQTILQEDNDLKVWVKADGQVMLDDEPASLGQLKEAFSGSSKDAQVVIKADKDVGHGRVVQVMDLARSHGLTRLAIATEANVQGGGGASSSAPPSGSSNP